MKIISLFLGLLLSVGLLSTPALADEAKRASFVSVSLIHRERSFGPNGKLPNLKYACNGAKKNVWNLAVGGSSSRIHCDPGDKLRVGVPGLKNWHTTCTLTGSTTQTIFFNEGGWQPFKHANTGSWSCSIVAIYNGGLKNVSYVTTSAKRETWTAFRFTKKNKDYPSNLLYYKCKKKSKTFSVKLGDGSTLEHCPKGKGLRIKVPNPVFDKMYCSNFYATIGFARGGWQKFKSVKLLGENGTGIFDCSLQTAAVPG